MITKNDIALQLSNYLNHQISIDALVAWAEDALIHGGADGADARLIMHTLGRIVAADSKDFGLLWEDCESILSSLGFSVQVKVEQAA